MSWKILMQRFKAIGVKRWLVGAIVTLGVGSGLLIAALLYLSTSLPNLESLADYNPPQSTRLYSDDGYLVGELALEKRWVIPTGEIPKQVIQAFLAAEDANFYEHEGLDYFGIIRAAIKNLRPGAHLQGASTITQQTVKTMVVGEERSYARKMREAILAYRLEKLLSKDDILYLYLNQIYFGSGAYGVERASQVYFGKSVRDLTLGQAAYLAAIPKSPNRYTLRDDPSAAKKRQSYVLTRMLENHWADASAVQKELAAPIPRPAEDPPYLGKVPHYIESVRRELIDRYGEEQVYQGGMTVYLGMNATLQAAAQSALRNGLENLARKHGYPGAALRIEVDQFKHVHTLLHQAFEQRTQHEHAISGGESSALLVWDLGHIKANHLKSEHELRQALAVHPLEENFRTTGLVIAVDPTAKNALVDLGSMFGRIQHDTLTWARRFSPSLATPAPHSPTDVINRGDLVEVTLKNEPQGEYEGKPVVTADLVPRPMAEGAVVVIDPHTRLVRALVGGYEQTPGGLIRATQSIRQPGSAFKPIVYAAALANHDITAASICPDSPVVIRDQWTGKAWKPENYEDGRYDGNITYRTALTKSKNTCSVKLIEKTGPAKVIDMAARLGVYSTLPENLTLALGTGDLRPIELANAYASIAAGGIFAEPIFIRKIVDRQGLILNESRGEPVRAMDEDVAYVLTNMMRSVIEEGTAQRAQILERPLAGKTGTSQQSRNVWFSGFSPDLVTTVWVGFDDNRPLGRATGSSAALPIWIEIMSHALEGTPRSDFIAPQNVVFRQVDRDTGEPSEGVGAIEEAFVSGTEPNEKTQALQSPFLIDEDADAFGAP